MVLMCNPVAWAELLVDRVWPASVAGWRRSDMPGRIRAFLALARQSVPGLAR